MSFRTLCRGCSDPWGSHMFVGKHRVRSRSAFIGFVCRRLGCPCRISLASIVQDPPRPTLAVPPLGRHEAKLPEVRA